MTRHSRKYGDRPSHPIYVWNGVLEPKHRKKIGAAIWEFLWCLDRITAEKDGLGILLGGKPISHSEMADSFKVSEKTILRHMDSLELYGYIERTLTPRGYTVRVLNSCKFTKQVGQICPTTEESGRTEVSTQVGQKCPARGDRSVQPNKSKQLNESVEQAAPAEPRPLTLKGSPLWNLIGVRRESVPPEFAELSEKLFLNKNGQSPSEFLGVCMDAWEVLGHKSQPPAIARATARLREQEQSKPTVEVRELEALPWKT